MKKEADTSRIKVNQFAQALSHPNKQVRISAIDDLVKFERQEFFSASKDIVRHLTRTILRDEDGQVRWKAAVALNEIDVAQNGSKPWYVSIVKELIKDQIPLSGLASDAPPVINHQHRAAYLTVFLSHHSANVRRTAVKALVENISHPEFDGNHDKEIRDDVLKNAEQKLVSLAMSDNDTNVKDQAGKALSLVGRKKGSSPR